MAANSSTERERRVGVFLKRKGPEFARKLDVKNMLSELSAADVIDDENFEALVSLRRNGASCSAMVQELLGMLRTKSYEHKMEFLRCVNAKQSHLVTERDFVSLLAVDVCDEVRPASEGYPVAPAYRLGGEGKLLVKT